MKSLARRYALSQTHNPDKYGVTEKPLNVLFLSTNDM